MTIDKGLRWRRDAGDFDTEQKKILLALSSKKWLWRTLDNLRGVTRLSDPDLALGLEELIDRGIVRGSFNRRTREPIFGLLERVGGVKPPQQRRW